MSGKAKKILMISLQACLFLLVFFSLGIKVSASDVSAEAPDGLRYDEIQGLFNDPNTIWGDTADSNKYRNAFSMAYNGFSNGDHYSALGGISSSRDFADTTGYMWSKSNNMLDVTKSQTFGFHWNQAQLERRILV